MRNKLICLIFIGVVAFMSVKLQAGSVKGRVIEGPQTGTVELYAFKDFFSWKTYQISQAEIRNGSFVWTTNISKTSLFRIKLRGKSFDLYLEPDGDYLVELRPNGLTVLQEPPGQLNARIQKFEAALKSIQPNSASRDSQLQEVHRLRNQLKVEPNRFVKNYGFIKLLQRENLIYALNGPVRTGEQLLAIKNNLIQPYLEGLNLNNPATTILLDQLGTNLLAQSEKPSADCWKDPVCFLPYNLKIADQVEDPLIRDLLKIRMIQQGNNTKAKRDPS